ncbi:hypothetical protein N9M66_01860 [Litoreibacter sp.]|nr:hypothetical protein [Litoreibacter sp.]
MFKPFIAAMGIAILTSTLPVAAAQNSQLVRSVEQRLTTIGFNEVDASVLTTSQLASLHLTLQGSYDNFLRRAQIRQEIQIILDRHVNPHDWRSLRPAE